MTTFAESVVPSGKPNVTSWLTATAQLAPLQPGGLDAVATGRKPLMVGRPVVYQKMPSAVTGPSRPSKV